MALIVFDGQNSGEKQAIDVETLIARGIDVLKISPLTSDALTTLALDTGIPVVAVDRKANAPVTGHLGAYIRSICRSAVDDFVDQLGGKRCVIVNQVTATIDRHDGAVDAIEGVEVDLVTPQPAMPRARSPCGSCRLSRSAPARARSWWAMPQTTRWRSARCRRWKPAAGWTRSSSSGPTASPRWSRRSPKTRSLRTSCPRRPAPSPPCRPGRRCAVRVAVDRMRV